MRIATLFACFCLISRINGQNLLLTYEKPPILVVCDNASFKVTVQNTGTAAASNIVLTAVMPLGLEYVVGSVAGAVETVAEIRLELECAEVRNWPIGGLWSRAVSSDILSGG